MYHTVCVCVCVCVCACVGATDADRGTVSGGEEGEGEPTSMSPVAAQLFADKRKEAEELREKSQCGKKHSADTLSFFPSFSLSHSI